MLRPTTERVLLEVVTAQSEKKLRLTAMPPSGGPLDDLRLEAAAAAAAMVVLRDLLIRAIGPQGLNLANGFPALGRCGHGSILG